MCVDSLLSLLKGMKQSTGEAQSRALERNAVLEHYLFHLRMLHELAWNALTFHPLGER